MWDLLAVYVVEYVQWAMLQLRYLALFLVTGIFLTVLLLSSYPFEPESAIKVFLFAIMAVIIGGLVIALFQMNKNATLSTITKSDIGVVSWNAHFVVNLILVLGVPGLAVLSSVFPEVRDFLFAWVGPAMQALAKN